MRNLSLVMLTFVIVIMVISRAVAAGESDVRNVVAGNNDFAFALYDQFVSEAKPNENLAFSPYSVSTALAMTCAGARGQTAAEMAGALHFSLSQDALHPAFGRLRQLIMQQPGEKHYELVIANRLWPQADFPLERNFLHIGSKFYQAEPQPLSFAAEPEAARKTINGWVSDQTKEKIPELFAPDSIKPSTTLVLTNAIYFLGDWLEQFDVKATQQAPFHLASDDDVQVPLMHQTSYFRYTENEDWQILDQWYQGKQLSMTILLPKPGQNLAKLTKELKPEQFFKMLRQCKSQKVEVFLPRFKVTSGMVLNDALQSLGMREAFTGSADFTGISARGGLFISEVVHKAYVDVNEKGTEAAAATGVAMMRASPAKPIPFRADRPFFFVIRHDTTKSLLFMGRVMNPVGP